MKWLKNVANMIALAVCFSPFVLWVSMFTGLINNSGNARMLLQVSIIIAVVTGLVMVARWSKDYAVTRHTGAAVEKLRTLKAPLVKPRRDGDVTDDDDRYPAGRRHGLTYGLRFGARWWL